MRKILYYVLYHNVVYSNNITVPGTKTDFTLNLTQVKGNIGYIIQGKMKSGG
jgi:hypothetical protein